MGFLESVGQFAREAVIDNGIKEPTSSLISSNLSSIVTGIGTFFIREMAGKLSRGISFTTETYSDRWMEVALYSILGKYNNLKKKNNIRAYTPLMADEETGSIAWSLDDGKHFMKYREWNLLIMVTSERSPQTYRAIRTYTIYVFSLSPQFIATFERDMRAHYADFVTLGTPKQRIPMFVSVSGRDGKRFDYWERVLPLQHRPLSTLYLNIEEKRKIVDTVNAFFLNRKLYERNGIPWNLKLFLHGAPRTGKDTVARVIASEWHRNIYYIQGSRTGEMIPDAITSTDMQKPLIVISDIDNYPDVINKVSVEGEKDGEEKQVNTSTFANMINALDGLRSGEGRIIIMTTNHIDKIHPTFLAPARCDLVLELKPVSPYTFRQFMFDSFQKNLPEGIKLIREDIKIPELQMDILFMKMGFDDVCKKYLKKGSY